MTALSLEIPTSGQATNTSREWLWLVPLLTLCALIVRMPYMGDHNADVDEQLYALIGSQIWQGQLPFVDLWDRKPFGLFLLFGLADASGLPAPWSYQLLATGFIVLGAVLLRRLALLLVDGGIATVLAMLYIVLMTIYGSQSAQAEVFHVPAILGMALLVRDTGHPQAIRRALLAMLIGGLALQVKYTVLPQCLFFGLWALWGQYRAGRSTAELATITSGFAAIGILPSAIVGLFYLAVGGWDEFWFANFVSFFLRAPYPGGRFVALQTLFLAPLIILAIAGTYARFRIRPPRDLASYRFFWAMFGASLATVYLPSTVYAYYFAALVPGALLVAIPFFDREGPFRVIFLVVTSVLLFGLLYYPSRIEASQANRAAMDKLAAAIEPHVDGDKACLWVFDGPTALYSTTDSCLPTRLIYPDHLNNALERNSLEVRQIDEVRRIFATQPPVVVTADRPFTLQNEEVLAHVQSTLAEKYVVIAKERIQHRNLSIWLRRDLSTPGY
ncbi:hypothetical protein [Qipengyuania qiaonensis]|uniref:Glycosyltransferase RgtA/B/C/D-like domain-containing protein n=1 Tax=Qipengyuania qiaonensis TaxID=2867240 RepID=A0ABS7J5E5_9SPHN|nr:hypothetical protein [Qipengyuania qiaonensis]MBX7482511.1 hypothetical protein [Qipengyuania qiaonensis]